MPRQYTPRVHRVCETCGKPFTIKASEDEIPGRGRFCSIPCAKTHTMRRSAAERFWENVDKNGPIPAHRPELGPCWVWTASTQKGYGQFFANGHLQRAHRFAYEMIVGPIPEGKLILHACDNPACCNPAHLSPGTHKDNTHDMFAKDRNMHITHPETIARGERNASRLYPDLHRGECNGRAKITEGDVREIRRRKENGASLREIAIEFGISRATVSSIALRKTWQHVE